MIPQLKQFIFLFLLLLVTLLQPAASTAGNTALTGFNAEYLLSSQKILCLSLKIETYKLPLLCEKS